MSIVKPIGPLHAKIMLVGEAPGLEESRSGIPFVGSSGKILNYILQDAGVDRAACRITNVVNVRPPGNNFGVFYEDKSKRIPTAELLRHRQRLYKEVESTNPNVIVAIGAEALKALTPHQYITKWRGSIIATNHGKVIPTIHPAAVMRNWGVRPVVVFDFQRVAAEASFPEVKTTNREFILNPSFDQVVEECSRLMKSEYIAFDIETTREGWPKQIKCIGFSDSSTSAICIPLADKFGGNYWNNPETEGAVWQLIAEVLKSKAKKIAQNAQFDVSILSYAGVPVNNLALDTMIMHHTLHPELPKGLDFLCSVYTNQVYYKSLVRQDLWRYNCLDAVITYEVAMVLLKELDDFGTKDFYFRHVHPMIDPIIDIQHRGVRVDKTLRSALAEGLRKTIKGKQELLDNAVGHELNVSAPKQMMAFLYDELGLEKQYNRKTGKITADEDALNKLARKNPSPLFKLILGIRGDSKLLSTWIGAPLGKDERLRTSYLIAGTLTGRLSSKKHLDGTGTDLQNVPPGPARTMVIPEDGNVFVGADLKHADTRVVAWLANAPGLMGAFKEGKDVHRYVGATLFNKPAKEITESERAVSKQAGHAAHYGMGSGGLAALLKCSRADAKVVLNTYITQNPAIEVWQSSVESQLRKTRILKTPFGRKRIFFGRLNNATLREAFNYIPQATVADITFRALVCLYWALPEGARVMLQTHDDLIFECKKSQVEQVKWITKNAMEFPIMVNKKELVIPVEFKVGENWDEV